jgi:hypothetical protein
MILDSYNIGFRGSEITPDQIAEGKEWKLREDVEKMEIIYSIF